MTNSGGMVITQGASELLGLFNFDKSYIEHQRVCAKVGSILMALNCRHEVEHLSFSGNERLGELTKALACFGENLVFEKSPKNRETPCSWS